MTARECTQLHTDPASPSRRNPRVDEMHHHEGVDASQLPPVRPPPRGTKDGQNVPMDSRRPTVQIRADVRSLLEAFIAQQKAAGAPWKPVRHHPGTLPGAAFAGLSPLKTTMSRLDPWQCHAGLSLHAVLDGTSSFEAALRRFRRDATEEEIETVLEYAQPMVAYRQREYERYHWVRAQAVNMEPLLFAFAAATAAEEAPPGAGQGGSQAALGRLLSAQAYVEAMILHRRGAGPSDFKMADMKNMKVLAGLYRSPAVGSMDAEPAPRTLDVLTAELIGAADPRGRLSVEELIEWASSDESLRAEFEPVVLIGCARRRSMIHGYWKSMEVYGSLWKPIDSAPSARPPSRGDGYNRGRCDPIRRTKLASSKSSQIKPSQGRPRQAKSCQVELASQLQASSSATTTPTARPTTTSQMRTPPNTSQMVDTSQMLTPRPPNLLARRHGPLTPRQGYLPDEPTPPVKPGQAKSSQGER